MASIVTDSSLFKTNDYRLKNASFWSKVCETCDLGIQESARHIVMQCPQYEEVRAEMLDEISKLACLEIYEVLKNTQDIFPLLLGRQPESVSFENMIRLCFITGKYITKMYDNVIDRV